MQFINSQCRTRQQTQVSSILENCPCFPMSCWIPRCWQQEVTQSSQLFSAAFAALKLTFRGFAEEFGPYWCPCVTFSEARRVQNMKDTLKRKEKLFSSFYTNSCSKRLRVPLSKFPEALPLQFSICCGELLVSFPKISESQQVCFMGLFVCFNPKEDNIVEFFPSERLW